MPVMLERWNDDMMDGLAVKVDGLAEQMREQRQEMRELRREIREQQQQTSDRLVEMQRSMFMGALILSGSYVAGFAALIGLIATRL
jgi:NAD/NADP transhydrogenase beta subunit